jgi:hypothetical protein
VLDFSDAHFSAAFQCWISVMHILVLHLSATEIATTGDA